MPKKTQKAPAAPKLKSFVRRAIDKHAQAIEEMKADGRPLNSKLGVGPLISSAQQRKMTEGDCILLLQGLCAGNPTRVITRDWFRKNSGLLDETWNQYFGKFNVFKEAAGIKIDRRANKLLLSIARHKNADDLRALNGLRRSYNGKYEKKTSGRWRTLLLASDTHDHECDPFCLRVFLDVARRLGVNGSGTITDFFHLGDLFDLPEFGKYNVDPRTWDPVGRMKWVYNEYLSPLRSYLGDIPFWLLEGNHELRVSALIATQTPAVLAVLADLHGMTIPKFLGLDRYEVNYVANGDLAAVDFRKVDQKKELERNWHIMYDCFLGCHYPSGRSKGFPGAHGHHHKHIVWPGDSPVYGAYEWHQLGAQHYRYATYADGQKWNNGFALVHIDTKTKATEFEYVTVGSTQCVAAGKHYVREKHELLGKV